MVRVIPRSFSRAEFQSVGIIPEWISSGICCERNTDALPARRPAPGRSNCVILKLLYKICVYASVLKILIKFLSYALFLLLSSLPLFHSSFSHFARRVPSIRENGTDDPSFRANRRVSIVERSTRHASSRDACDVNEGRFYYFVPLFVANSLSRIIDVLISLKFFFFSFNKHALSGGSRYKGLSEIHSPFLQKHSFPSLPVPSFACSCLSFSYFLSIFTLVNVFTYIRDARAIRFV